MVSLRKHLCFTKPNLVWAISMVRIWVINEFIPILSFLDLLIKANLYQLNYVR